LFVRSLYVRTRDGAQLAATLYEPKANAHGTLLVNSGIAIPQSFYAAFARHAATTQGLRVVTYDYRGFGASSDAGGPTPTLTRWAEEDYPTVLRWVLRYHGDEPVHALGHSFGGQVLGLPDEAAQLTSAAIVASMRGYVENFEVGRARAKVLFQYAVPTVTRLLGYAPRWLGAGEALPAQVARQWARWCLHPEYYLSDHPEYRERLARFSRPLTFLSFDDDDYAPLVNVRWLVELYANARPLHLHATPQQLGLESVGHLGFFRAKNQAAWPLLLSQLRTPALRFAVELPAAQRRAPVIALEELMEDLQYGVA